MKSYKLIHELLNLVEKLEDQNMGKEVSLQDFAGFLINNLDGPLSANVNLDTRFGKKEAVAQQLAHQLDNNIGRLFIYMSRYAKSYIKKALEGTHLQTAEDFTALAILLTHDHLAKSDLISRNLQEKTSGIEVIKRLIAAGLVTQWDDTNDKRGKRIGITTKGRELLYVVFADMNHVGKMITGTLTVPEKLSLQYLLQKLEFFHYQHYQDRTIATKADLETIVQHLPQQ